MPRYFIGKRTTQWVEDDADWSPALVPALTVTDHDAVDTGLIDADGNPIMRAPNEMGFVWRDE